MKIREQKELSESIIKRITKELENPKVLQQILQQSIADVESMYYKSYRMSCTNTFNRDRAVESTIDWGDHSRTNRFPLSPPLFINYLCNSQSRIHPTTTTV